MLPSATISPASGALGNNHYVARLVSHCHARTQLVQPRILSGVGPALDGAASERSPTGATSSGSLGAMIFGLVESFPQIEFEAEAECECEFDSKFKFANSRSFSLRAPCRH